MRAVIQRVTEAQVSIEGTVHARIGPGMLILLGIEEGDEIVDVIWLANKIAAMRLFSDSKGVMNLSITQTGASVLVISQFTLHASTKKGNRPSYIRAARPERAIPLYEAFCRTLANLCPTQTGVFGADMQVGLINDGPVTIIIDSKNRD